MNEMHRLKDTLASLNTFHQFKIGDLVRWKKDAKNKKWPAQNDPAIVTQVLEEPRKDQSLNCGSPYFAERLDLVIAFFDRDDEFLEWHVDSRRFEPYPE